MALTSRYTMKQTVPVCPLREEKEKKTILVKSLLTKQAERLSPRLSSTSKDLQLATKLKTSPTQGSLVAGTSLISQANTSTVLMHAGRHTYHSGSWWTSQTRLWRRWVVGSDEVKNLGRPSVHGPRSTLRFPDVSSLQEQGVSGKTVNTSQPALVAHSTWRTNPADLCMLVHVSV